MKTRVENLVNNYEEIETAMMAEFVKGGMLTSIEPEQMKLIQDCLSLCKELFGILIEEAEILDNLEKRTKLLERQDEKLRRIDGKLDRLLAK